MIEKGQPMPRVDVWPAPAAAPIGLDSLIADGPVLLVFYLYDWSST